MSKPTSYAVGSAPYEVVDNHLKLATGVSVNSATKLLERGSKAIEAKHVVFPATLANGGLATNPKSYYPDGPNVPYTPKLPEYYWMDKSDVDGDPAPWKNTIRDMLYFNEDTPNGVLKGYRRDKGSAEIVALEDRRNRIMNALAMLDSMHLVNTNNRNLMLNWVGSEAESGRVARANYEVMLSNILDVRDTHVRTQRKIQDMARLGEVQTYYKMHYEMKKKILLETILVVVLLVVLYALRKSEVLGDDLFNLFFVIVLFAYIFFRLSWQIVDFNSRDKRYFDKYDWGTLDGSFNFNEFEDISSNASMYYTEVNDCLEKFIKRLKTAHESWPKFENFICGYTQLAREKMKSATDLPLKESVFHMKEMDDTEIITPMEGMKLHKKFLHILIYETLVGHIQDCKNAKQMEATYTFPFHKKISEVGGEDSCPPLDPNTDVEPGMWVKNCEAMKDYVDIKVLQNVRKGLSSMSSGLGLGTKDELDTILSGANQRVRNGANFQTEIVPEITKILKRDKDKYLEGANDRKHELMKLEIEGWFNLLKKYSNVLPNSYTLKNMEMEINCLTAPAASSPPSSTTPP